MSRRVRVFLCVLALAALHLAYAPVPARADLGVCAAFDDNQPHQGGFESAVTANARGVFGIITVRLPDLCNPPIPVNPNGSLDSGSTVYVMLTNYGDGVGAWYQIGYYRIPGKSCPHVYMQWRLSASVVTEEGPCATVGTKYRFVIKKLQDYQDFYWQSYVLRDSDGTVFWDAPGDPEVLGFTPADGEYSSEVINEKDQSGGGNASRAKLENAVWYDANLNIVYADIPAADRFCQMCNPSTNGFPVGPYNTNWLTNRSFEVWTDGF